MCHFGFVCVIFEEKIMWFGDWPSLIHRHRFDSSRSERMIFRSLKTVAGASRGGRRGKE